MKRNILVILSFVLCSAGMAQNANSRQPSLQKGQPPRNMAILRTNEMTKTLSLNASQKAAVLKLNQEFEGKMSPQGGGGMQPPQGQRPPQRPGNNGQQQGPPPPPPSGERPPMPNENKPNGQQPPKPDNTQMNKMRKEHEAMMTTYNNRLKKILTASQYNTYLTQRNSRPPKKK
jgi:hypothetical protein